MVAASGDWFYSERIDLTHKYVKGKAAKFLPGEEGGYKYGKG